MSFFFLARCGFNKYSTYSRYLKGNLGCNLFGSSFKLFYWKSIGVWWEICYWRICRDFFVLLWLLLALFASLSLDMLQHFLLNLIFNDPNHHQISTNLRLPPTNLQKLGKTPQIHRKNHSNQSRLNILVAQLLLIAVIICPPPLNISQ